jgi:outer membrane receptor protein involved in Fe transport
MGSDISYATFQGIDRSSEIRILGEDGRLFQTTNFTGDGEIGASDWVVAGYFQDKWRPTPKLGLDLGLRYDYEHITQTQRLSPRFAFSYSPRENGRTILKGGFGIFYGHVFLHAGDFEDFQNRIETFFGPDGSQVGAPLIFQNRVDPEGLEVPRSKTWSVELNQQFGDWMMRVRFRERRGSREMVLDRVEDGPDGSVILLSSRGESTIREFDFTVRKELSNDGKLFFSYVKSRTTGTLNNFGDVYGDVRQPLLLEAEYSLQRYDVPHRFLSWGVINLPKGIAVVPGIEWRSGFPYTVFAPNYSVVGERNRGGRFPTFLSIDLRVTKKFVVRGRAIRLGFEIFNLTDHSNPRDVFSNVASPLFGDFTNTVPFSARLRFSLGF